MGDEPAAQRLQPSQIPAHIVAACQKLKAAGYEAWLVGGSVRDLLRGKPAKDFDVATSAEPRQVAAVFGTKRTIPTGEKHGTVTVLLDNPARPGEREHLEVTTYRGEGAYSDGRRPDAITFVRTIEEDLKRRDFTMNAIAFDPVENKMCDPYGGRADLAVGLIRAVGNPDERFFEDGLRAMRAVRFAAQHGFGLDPQTEQAIARALETFRKVSAERVRDELLKILLADRPSVGLELMRKTGLLGEVIPELLEGVGLHQNKFHAHDVWHHTLATVDATVLGSTVGPPWIVRMAALLHDVAKPRTAQPRPEDPKEKTFYRHEIVGAEMTEAIARRLKLANKEREHLTHLVLNHMFWYSAEWTDGTVRRFVGRIGTEAVPDLFALRAGDVLGRGHDEDPEREIAALRQRIADELKAQAAFKVSDLDISGKDVMDKLGCPPGPIIGEVMRRLLEKVLDDRSLNTREKLLELVPEVAKEKPPA